MTKIRTIWIDDMRHKAASFNDVFAGGFGQVKGKLEIIEVDDDAITRLGDWADENELNPPDLIIIDHIFNKSLPFKLKGSSVAHLLRREFPSVPMVCVTAAFGKAASFDQEDISEYTALFLYQELERHIEDLFVLAKDFKKLDAGSTSVREHLVRSLKAPKYEKDRLERILPSEFRTQKHATTQHRMAYWIFNVFLKKPGLLYDKLHAATLLGLTEDGFDKVEPLFAKARYNGVFATDSNPCWWLRELQNQLYELVSDDAPDMSQYAGRTLPGITPGDYSACYVTKKSDPPPKIVVSVRSAGKSRSQVVRPEYAIELDESSADPGFEIEQCLKPRAR
jgi:hypothetical protein